MPDPPTLGLLMGAVGKTLVVAGAGAFLLSALASLSREDRVEGKSLATVCFWVGVACTTAVFAVHIGLLLGARYEFAYVFENSDNSMPFVFRLSAAWAAQEGSFLLWTFMSALVGAVLLNFTGPYKRWFLVAFGAVMGVKLGILMYESPFQLVEIDPRALQATVGATMSAVPTDGQGMNPVLQNLWMVIHPLVIFAGFGALTPLFCWSVSAAVSKDWHTWAVLARPFVIATMALLGVGLSLGGIWAYETLGWGGFWAWDPVENVALVPWIAVVVLMHGLLIQVNRGRWVRLNILLGALPFVWFLYGTFLTRSGVLADVSVHSFAEMNEGAHGILLWTLRVALSSLLFGTGFVLSRPILTKTEPPVVLAGHSKVLLYVSGAIVLLAVIVLSLMDGLESAPVVRVSGVLVLSGLAVLAGVWTGKRTKPAVAEARTDAPGHRIVWLGAGVATLYVIGAAAAIGMSFPFLANVFGEQAWVVGESSYNEALAVPFVIVAALIGAVPFLGWTKTASDRIKRLWGAAAVSLALTAVIVVSLSDGPGVAVGLPVWVCVFAVIANAMRVIERMKAKSGGTGAFLVHAGFALMLIGLIVSRVFGDDQSADVSLSSTGEVLGYTVGLKSDPDTETLTQKDNRVQFELTRGSVRQPISPVLYYDLGLDGEYHPVTRPYILRSALHDLYFSVTSRLAAYKTNIAIEPGETREIDRFTVRYVEANRDEDGALLSVMLEVTDGDETTTVEPRIEIMGDTAKEGHATVNDDLKVALHALDAASDRALISLLPPNQVFTVQLLYRPLTILVWIGTALVAVGGFIAMSGPVRRARAALRALRQTNDRRIGLARMVPAHRATLS